MRYYRIEIGGAVPAVYTSLAGGQADPGALNIELDIQIAALDSPQNAFVRIWGVSLQTISQSRDFNGAPIKVYGGMSKGLPLANPEQQGLLVQGVINQSFGNWVGTSMTLDLIITTAGNTDTTPNALNITLNWKKGQTLQTAIANTLSVAAPGLAQNINISDDLVLPADDTTGTFATLAAFATYVKAASRSIKGSTTYGGVDILYREDIFQVYDGTTEAEPKDLQFIDFIGQPTWIAAALIQFNTVMRADLAVDNYIRFPRQPVVTTAASNPRYRDKTAFQGVFHIQSIHHVGSFRQPDGMAWVSVFEAAPTQSVATNG
jgi:hypothetical protein